MDLDSSHLLVTGRRGCDGNWQVRREASHIDMKRNAAYFVISRRFPPPLETS